MPDDRPSTQRGPEAVRVSPGRGAGSRLPADRPPLHRLHEVASFFPHYKLEKGPDVEVHVCRDMACHLRNATQLRRGLRALANEIDPTGKTVKMEGVSCLGQCDHAPAASINDHIYFMAYRAAPPGPGPTPPSPRSTSPTSAADRSPWAGRSTPTTARPVTRPSASSSRRSTRHRASSAAIDGLLDALKVSTLRGMGGARFPTHIKWAAVRAQPGPTRSTSSATATSPSPAPSRTASCSDGAPYLLVEGMVLAGLTTGADPGLHLHPPRVRGRDRGRRGGHPRGRGDGGSAARTSSASGLNFPVEVFVSPGGYICGEESALLEAMEDRRAEPRNKPPFPTVAGLYNKPTVINNVETLMWTPADLPQGGRVVSRPGGQRLPGALVLLDQRRRQRAGRLRGPLRPDRPRPGLRRGRRHGRRPAAQGDRPLGPLRRLLPGGDRRSENLLPSLRQGHLAAGAGELRHPRPAAGLRTSSARWTACSAPRSSPSATEADMVDMALNPTEFYRNESCGKCVPCRRRLAETGRDDRRP